MTKPIRRPCRKPGCNALTLNASGLCDAHQADDRARHDAERGTAHERGYGASWRQLRARKLRAYPLCEVEGCNRVAVLVHHIDHDPTNNDPANLMSMCRDHHEQHHGRQAAMTGHDVSGLPTDPARPWASESKGGGGGQKSTAFSRGPGGLSRTRSAKIEGKM